MSRPAGTHPARAAGALLLVGALVVAAPAGLVRATRHRFGSWSPLAGVEPPWSWRPARLAGALREPLADDAVVDVVVRVCLVTVWAVLAIVVVTIAGELVHQIRQRGMPAPHVRGLGWAQRVARWAVGGLLVALPIGPAAASSPHPEPTAALLALADRPAPHVVVGATTAHGQRDAPSSDPASATGPEIGARAKTGGPGTGDPADGGDVVHVVRPGESVYSIAARLAGGDPQLTITIADAVLDANLGQAMTGGRIFTNPAYIEVGWRLVLPAPWANGAGRTLVGGTAVPTADHVVVTGDTLSAIAAERLGDPADWPAIWEANAGRTMPDGRRFEDPDLIVPGWPLRLPTPGADDGDLPPHPTTTDRPSPGPDDGDAPPRPATTDRGDTAPTSPRTADATPPTTPAAGDDRPIATTEPPTPDARTGSGSRTTPSTGTEPREIPSPNAVPAPTTGPDATTTPGPAEPADAPITGRPGETSRATRSGTPRPTAATTTTLPDAPGTPPGPADEPGANEVPDAGSPIRLEHAAFLAAGVLALVAVRRRQRLRAVRAPVRIPDPAPDVAALERDLRTVEPGERALRVDVAVRAVAAELLCTPGPAAVDPDEPSAEGGAADGDPADGARSARVGILLVADDGGITVHLTEPASLPAPWRGSGTTWELRAAVPVELLADAARRVGAPCPALVHLGRSSDGREVLADLEAAGELVVEAPAPMADEVVAAIAATTATSERAEVAHLVSASLPLDAFVGHPNGHRVDSSDAAVELATSLAGATARQSRTTFDLRARRTGGDVWEPVLVFATTDDAFVDGGASRLPEPGHGIAVVAGAVPGTVAADRGARLCRTDDQWTLALCDERIAMTPVGLTEQDLGRLADLVASAAAPLDVGDTDDSRPADHRDGPAERDAARPAPPSTVTPPPFSPTPHRILVRLLGSVDVVDGTGRAGEFERSKAVELIAWLATHRDRATRSGARTALWELDVRDATFANVVSEARRAMARLVDPPNGEEWLARTLNEQLPLHPAVVTDADLVAERVAHAETEPPDRAIATLRPALELIRDLPFSGTDYLWPDAEGISSRLVLLCTTACSRLAAHALSVGDLDLVFEATDRGRRVLPGHEELIGLRMRAHARTGDLAGVRHEWEAYERVIIADAWSDGEPAPKLAALRRELLAPGPA